MSFIHVGANGNLSEAVRLDQSAFPDQSPPSHLKFAAIYRRFVETRSVALQTRHRERSRRARTNNHNLINDLRNLIH